MIAPLILMPFVVVLALNLPFRKVMNKTALWAGLLLCLYQIVGVLFPLRMLGSGSLAEMGTAMFSVFKLDNLSAVMLLAIAIVGLATLFISRYLVKDDDARFSLVNLIILSLVGMNGVITSNDLFSLYVFIEITAVTSYILIAYEKGRDAFEGAFKYLVLSAIATTLMLAAIALFIVIAGSVSFPDIKAVFANPATVTIAVLAMTLFVAGLFIKGGLVPFHGWLPDAYASAPSSVSVLLAGIVTKVCGIYTLIRLVTHVFGFDPRIKVILLAAGTVSIIVGAVAALGQSNFKRMLAYSSISQVGYIVIGLGSGTELGIAGAIFHLFNHSVFKSLLFVNSAAVEKETGTVDMDKLGGIANRMPITGTTSVLGFLSTAGIPPLSGFWSKLLIIVGVWKGGYPVLAGVAILASLLTLAYFLSMQRRVFFGKLASHLENVREAGLWATIPAIILALITLALGLSFPWLFDTFLMPIRSIL
jgi:multicomponent Na+:H+ antiporter subunit D